MAKKSFGHALYVSALACFLGSQLSLAAPDVPATDEERAFAEARELYSRGSYEAALKKLEEFSKRFSSSRFTSQSENLAGLCYLLTKHPSDAITHFKHALDNSSEKPSTTPYLLYNLAKAQFEAGQNDETQQTLSKIDPAALDKENNAKFHHLKASIQLRNGLPLDSAKEILAFSRAMDETQLKEFRSAFSSLLDQALRQIKESSQLSSLYLDFEDAPLADGPLFYLASQERSKGELSKSEIHIQTLLNRFPHSDYFSQASALSRAQEPRDSEAPTEPGAIGVLVPLKGKFAKFGERALQGIEMAFNIFDSTKPDPKVTLVIEDSGDEPEQAVKALNRLVTKHHVVAVVGPLLTKGIDQVSKRAQELHVPLLSLAKQSGPASDYVISAGMTFQLQAYELARHAIQKMKLHRFAILAPKDKVGEDFMHHFWDAVESLGGEITGAEAYSPSETDFRQQVDKLSGLYYTEARQKELNQLARLREENQIKKRTRKTEQFYNLTPIVDYDAVFVPDEPKVAGQVLPTFAYRDVDKVRFLGPSAWNSPELFSRAQASAEGAVFVDAFFSESASRPVQKFIEDYRALFSQDPTATDALAYDAAKILDQALRESGSERTRGQLLARLKEVSNHPGVTGKITYQNGQFYRELGILSIQQGKITEARANQ